MFEDICINLQIAEIRICYKCTIAMRFVSLKCILNSLCPSTFSPSSLFRAGKSFSVHAFVVSQHRGPFYQWARFNQAFFEAE